MRASVIIKSKDEADRLRLTLASLAAQSERAQVVVVNDGSSDHTTEVIAEAAVGAEVIEVRHLRTAGRSVAANSGAARATGDILIFLDGDTLAAPDFVAGHLGLHRQYSNLIVRGETWHLRCTRPFLNPETGTPMPGEEARVMRMSDDERSRAIVTRRDIRQAFGTIDRRAQAGVYPGMGPRKLLELEMHALNTAPDSSVLWAAAAGSNQSVDRAAFLEAGGFHDELLINAHRELALRLCKRGMRMAGSPVRTYHMIHRSGWRDPLQETEWERIFYAAHPIPEVALLPFLWSSLSDAPLCPAPACIRSLDELAVAANNYREIDGLENVREAHLRDRLPGIAVK
jgi:glycosyltransferase involved in cell wall biosynthesis